jgi:hypothetical protein
MKVDRFYHYAPWEYLSKIVATGKLIPSNAGGSSNEAALLWFSANQKWEPTATKVFRSNSGAFRRMKFHEQEVSFGCIRFGI